MGYVTVSHHWFCQFLRCDQIMEYFFRLLEGSHQIHGTESITEDSAKILLQRGLKRVSSSQPETEEDKWEFTRDLKHRVAALYGYPQEVIRKLASEVKCPHLIVKAIQGNLYEVSYRYFGHFIVTYML